MPPRPAAAGRRARGDPGPRAQADPAHAGDVRLSKLALALLLAAACGARETGPPREAPRAAEAGPTVRVPDSARQLVTVVTDGWDATAAELRLWTRRGAGWEPAGAAWPGVVGRSGAAWGRGLHGDGAPGRPGPVKREGDGRSPAGLFAIGPSFGYAPAPPAGARVPYTPVDAAWRCVDDPASAHYNRVLDERTVTKDWASAEDMRRADDLYAWVVELGHNAGAAPGGGSCIFLHVWSGPGSTTAGCTAMAEPALVQLLEALDPAAAPVLALLPRDEYEAVRAAWGLP